jgi:hypothetical protein
MHPKITYLVSAPTPEEKTAWMNDLNTHARECQEKARFYQGTFSFSLPLHIFSCVVMTCYVFPLSLD